MSFIDNISDFYHWMAQFEEVNAKSRTNYISWLKFLSKKYEINGNLDDEKIQQIVDNERMEQRTRHTYTSDKDLVNFKSALRKYKKFVESNYVGFIHESILSEMMRIEKDDSIISTEKEAIINSRIGQGLFRKRLISYWKGCSVTNCKMINILMASHIKPWRISSNKERLDLFNGLLLAPNYDKLFDSGFISFDNAGMIIFSKEFPKSERKILNIDSHSHLIAVDERHFEYLKYHRDNCLIQ